MPFIKYIFTLTLMVLAASTQAAPVTVMLDAEVFFGSFTGATATGTLVYDDSLVVLGDETISAADGLEVEFVVFGQTFTETDDIDFDSQPSLVFEGFEIVGFDWVVSEIDGDILTEIDEPGVFDFSMFDVLQDIGPGGEVFISGELFVDDFSVVPLPAALPLFIVGLGLLGRLRRTR